MAKQPIFARRQARRQSIAGGEFEKARIGKRGSLLAWLYCTEPISPLFVNKHALDDNVDETEDPGDSASETTIDSATVMEKKMEQLMFDLYLNSPTKKRRQREAVKAWETQRDEEIVNPTSPILRTEQLVFDIYLNSPSKQRRQLEATREWEKANNATRSVSCFPQCPAMNSPTLTSSSLESKRRVSMPNL